MELLKVNHIFPLENVLQKLTKLRLESLTERYPKTICSKTKI